ncbi:hypothetical protein KIS4809_3326 [Bacillus sp. ZZV12-4809]|nr:hypothetical protein KIS4809_3326 [Bacillus sp. ZZV12-4809]
MGKQLCVEEPGCPLLGKVMATSDDLKHFTPYILKKRNKMPQRAG